MSTSIEQEINPSTEQNLSVGQTLLKTRQDKNLTLDKVNQDLRINIRILKAFENDQFEIEDFALVYLRAYLKKYAEYLGLDPKNLEKRAFSDKIKSVSKKVENQHSKKMHTVNDTYVRENNPSVIRRIYFIILTIAILSLIGFIIYKTLNDNKGVNLINNQSDSAQLSSNSTQSDNNSNKNSLISNSTDNSNSNSNSNEINNSVNTNIVNNQDNSSTAEKDTDTVNVNNSNKDQTNSDNTNNVDSDSSNADSNLTINNNESSNNQVAPQNEPTKATVDYSKLPTQGTFDPQNIDIPNKGLYILMKGDSWNRVIDNNKGKTIYAKVFNKGTYLYIYQPGSYSVRIGKPYKVEVYYNGKQLVLHPNASRVANFTVGN